MQCDTLIRAGVLVTQNEAREVIEDAAVAVTGGLVTGVAPWSALKDAQAGEFVDCSGDIVLPGLVNTHTHAAMTVFRGMADDLPLMEWLSGHIWPAEARLTPEVVRLGVRLACAEMIASGATTFCDLYVFEKTVAEAAHEAGMRAVLGEGLFDTPNASYKNLDEALARMEELEDFASGKDMLTPCMVAHSVYATSHDSLVLLARRARERSMTLTLHAAESPAETAMCLERFGRRPVEVLEGLGLLGPGLLVAHAVDVTPAEVALLASRGVAVAHNPRSNMKLASGMAPVAAMRASGVCVGLGTDGAASNNALNMFAEMAAAGLLAKVREGDPTALPAQALLDMATLDGARALGLDGVGAIRPGWKADIVALDGRAAALNPRHDPVSLAAYSASGGEVRLTMAGGRVLYRDGEFLTVDHEELLQRMVFVRKWARGS